MELPTKKNIDDVRESPALKIISDLKIKNVHVNYHDPYIKFLPKNRNYNTKLKSIKLNKSTISNYDGVLVCTDHDNIDYKMIYKNAKLIFDTRNVYKFDSEKIIKI